MKTTRRILAFVLMAAMLMAVAPFAYADAITADAVLAFGQKHDVTLSRDKISYTLKITIPEDGEYVIWSESEYDTYLTVYDSYGNHYGNDDDDGRGNNFKLFLNADEDEVYYLKVEYYSGAYKETFPVYFDKPVAPTDVVLYETDMVVTAGKYSDLRYYVVPGNAYNADVEFTAQKGYIDYIGSFYIEYEAPDETGEDTITVTFPEYPDVAPSTHKITVVEDTQNRVLTLDTPVSGTLPMNIYAMSYMEIPHHAYEFTAPEDGTYVFDVDASDTVYLLAQSAAEVNAGKMTSLTLELEKDQVADIYVMPFSISGRSSAFTGHISYTITAKNGVPATGVEFNAINEGNYYVGVGYDFTVSPSNLGGIMEEYEFSCSDEENSYPDDLSPNNIKVIFYEPGQYTITAKGKTSGKTDSITINVSDSEITLDKPCTIELSNNTLYMDSEYNTGYMYFIAPEDGTYKFEFSADKDVAVDYDEGEYGNHCVIELEEGEWAEFYPYIDDDLFTDTVNYTASVKKMSVAEEIVLPEKLEIYLGQTVYFAPFLLQDSVGELPEINIEDEEIVYCSAGDNYGYNLKACNIGQTTVEIGGKEMIVEVKDFKVAEPDEKYEIAFDKDIIKDAYVFTAPSTGWYTVNSGTPYTTVEEFDSGNSPYYAYNSPYYAYNDNFSNNMSYYLEKGVKYYITVEHCYVNTEFSISKVTYATGIEFEQDTVTIYKGENIEPDISMYKMQPANAMREDIKDITASVDGIIDLETGEALKTGTTVLTFETEYGLKADVTVIVVDETYRMARELKLDKTELTLNAGSSDTLVATTDVKDRKVIFSVADETIATVDEDGKVVAKKAGETIVYAYCDNMTVECKLTVKEIPIQDTTKVFKDVKAGKWYVDAVNYNYSYNFIAGITTDEFGVSTNVTRGMFITILARIAGVDTSKNDVTTRFTDVPTGKYYTAAIKWASENNIVAGMSDTTFEPNSPLQRQQLCVMIVNFANHQKVEIKAVEDALGFSDAGSFAKWSKDAIAICQKADIVNGYNEGGKVLFKPTNTATRAEAAQILYKFHKDFVAK